MRLDEKLKNKQTTTLIEYGMNPGLISTFVRYGLKRLTREVLEYQIENSSLNEELYEAYQLNKYNSMAKLLKIRVIHCSEIDTQVPQKTDEKDKLYNTWSCLGLIDEGCDPLEIILGSHENLPKIIEKMGLVEKGIDYSNYYEQVLMVNKPCYSVKVNSVVPNLFNKGITFEKIEGRCIHHGESISLNRFLSDDTYSPTIHYVYKLSQLTSNYLDTKETESIKKDGLDNNWKVMNMYDNQLDGNDNVGALFVLEENPMRPNEEPYMYWTGSILSSNYTRDILGDKYFGPTTIQVMSGILCGLSYILENKEMGLVFGESLPESFVIPKIKKYLGYFYSGEVADSNIKIQTEFHNLLC
jgi:homospermidine synthase